MVRLDLAPNERQVPLQDRPTVLQQLELKDRLDGAAGRACIRVQLTKFVSECSRQDLLQSAEAGFAECSRQDLLQSPASGPGKATAYENITQADREQAKRVVYSVIYGIGKERLAECLGTTPAEANTFLERFLQKYRVSDFTQKVIQECDIKVTDEGPVCFGPKRFKYYNKVHLSIKLSAKVYHFMYVFRAV
ncbi:unnamed protein product [Ranitomeya imitator]|uniref:DNA-directed DNA polymerase family A palm domain-containing protein n=1 Tax=Ranitomeya imitator TaxID=111125 RepID=A0ABN9LX92_9NEOB|nr:unnamed protein product [Ranitomeya imitator]